MSTDCIRPAAAGDFDAIAAITNHYIRNTMIHFGSEDVAADELAALWRQHLELYPWLVVEVDGAVAGYAKGGAYRARTAYRHTVETAVYLAPDRCGRGLGEPLYRRLVAVLRAQGFHVAIGGIALPNPRSVRLHERLGFTACGVVREAGRKFDRWHDVGFWQLRLQPSGAPPRPLRTPQQAFGAGAADG